MSRLLGGQAYRASIFLGIVLSGCGGQTALDTAMQSEALSEVNEPIAPSEMFARAQYWVDEKPPYSSDHSYRDPNGKLYRTDCTGLVSMAWHLDHSYTGDLSELSTMITKDELEPGDLILAKGDGSGNGHAVLFEKWDNAAHNSYHASWTI